MHEISGTLFHRWYVTVFGLAFLWFAVRQLGWRRTLVYGVVAFGVGECISLFQGDGIAVLSF